jgi:hypothetical protein
MKLTLKALCAAVILGAGMWSAFALAAPSQRPALDPAATCTAQEHARRKRAVTTYRKKMPAERAAYFRRHKSAKARKAFVKRQQARLESLQAAARCTVRSRTTTSTVASTSTVSTTTTTTTTTTAPVGVTYGPPLPRSGADRADDRTGLQVHVVYAVASDGADRALDTNGSLSNSVASFQTWLAGKAGGRALRVDTSQGSLDITFFRLVKTDAAVRALDPFIRDELQTELRAAGFTDPQKLYAVYYDGTSDYACGGGAWPPALVGSVAALYLKGLPSGPLPCSTNQFAAAGAPPAYLEFAMLHEIMHTLGFAPTCAPHQWRSGHVSDNASDLMWSGDSPWAPNGWGQIHLDYGNDDYYKAPVAGCLDFDDSTFLAG